MSIFYDPEEELRKEEERKKTLEPHIRPAIKHLPLKEDEDGKLAVDELQVAVNNASPIVKVKKPEENNNSKTKNTGGGGDAKKQDKPKEKPVEEKCIHFCRVSNVSSASAVDNINIFSHPLYYLQNGYLDETETSDDIHLRDCCKALLFLHTLPFLYDKVNTPKTKLTSFFNNTSSDYANRGGTEVVPLGYLLIIGGLIWRKRYIDEKGSDPIRYSVKFSNGVIKDLFVKPNRYNPLLTYSDGKIIFCVMRNGSNNKMLNSYDVTYDEIVGTANKPIVEQRLVEMFEEFVDNDFQKIKKACELNVSVQVGNKSETNFPDSNNPTTTYIKSETTWNTVENIKTSPATYTDIVTITNILQTDAYRGKSLNSYNLLCGDDILTTHSVDETITEPLKTFTVSNFKSNYVFGFARNGILYTYFSETNIIQNIFRKLYYWYVIATTIPVIKNPNGIKKNALKSYFKGYAKVIEHYAKESDNNTEYTPIMTETQSDRDLKCEIYLSLKNVWDRWLCGYYYQKDNKLDMSNPVPGKEYFKVKNFFENNFIFMDSFYTNIYNKLKLNCDLILKEYKGDVSDKTGVGKNVVNHIGSIAAAHRCMMFNFPDNINFSERDMKKGQSRGGNMIDNMVKMFTPIAANKVEKPEYSNKFTIIYTHSANKLDGINRNEFVPDGFDIWSENDGTGVAPVIFNSECKGIGETEEDMYANNSRMAYKVPAFGVAYSRQNNSYWKNVDVSMDNMSVTEQAIRAEAYIAEKGNTNQNKVCFYGQDVYSLYQAYSYLVTVEMMGDAQIQPLMYFQLMNIPMFRGTYMIIRVEHSITQGNMITKFTGVKMSNKQPPMVSSWFTMPPEEESQGDISPKSDSADNGVPMLTIDGSVVDIEDDRLSRAIQKYLNSDGMYCDVFVQKVFGDKELNVKIIKKLNEGV